MIDDHHDRAEPHGGGTSDQPTSSSRRRTHHVDPVSAVLGIIACVAGAVTIAGAADPFGTDATGVWIAATIAAIGIALLPWDRIRRPPKPIAAAPMELSRQHEGDS